MVKTVGKRGGSKPASSSGAASRRIRIRTDLVIVALLGLGLIGVFAAMFLRKPVDHGVRLWLLNHAPDQLIILNPDSGEVDKAMLVADGLQQLVINHRKDTAYVANVVDVSNRVSVIDTRSYMKKDQIIVDGVPQGLAVFPDDRYLAVITGNKTDFMAGGFDVIDLHEQSTADPTRKRVAYHERNLSLTAYIAVDEQGENIFCLDAKSSKLFIFSFSQKKLVRSIEFGAAPMGLLYPTQGDYFFVSSIANDSITIFKKAKNAQDVSIAGKVTYGRFRQMALSNDAKTLYAPVLEKMEIAVIDVASQKATRTYKTPEGCSLICLSPEGDSIYAVAMDTGKIFVINAADGKLVRTIPTKGEFRDVKVLLNSEKPAVE
jgi:DNA-binding beta-propeller fold protein YncE